MDCRQWGTTRGVTHVIFFFYLNEVLNDIANSPLGCELSGYTVNIFCYTYDIALQASTKNALKFMLDILAPRFEKLCFEINVEKPCNTVF